jgi:hypothetical protein
MTKLIVEMEMPKACPCEFAYYSSHGIFRPCFAWYGIPARWSEVEKCAENGTRPDWCPIKGEISEIELMHLEEERAFAARNIVAERKGNEA